MVVVDPEPLLAITLRQPWAWSIRYARSPLINLDWRPPPNIAHQYIGLHVGKAWTKRERIHVSELAARLQPDFKVPLEPEGYAFSEFFAIGRVAGFVDLEAGEERGPFTRCVTTTRGPAWVGGQFSDEDVERILASKWWFGPCAWILRHVRYLPEPISIMGKPRLWTVPASDALNAAAQVGV